MDKEGFSPDRRQFLTGGLSFLLSSTTLLQSLDQALAQAPQDVGKDSDQEKLAHMAEEQVQEGIKRIEKTYGVDVELAEESGTYGRYRTASFEYSALKDSAMRLRAVATLSRLLLMYPPLEASKAGIHPVNTSLRHVRITDTLTARDTRCGDKTTGGTAEYGAGRLTLPMRRDPFGANTKGTFDTLVFSHEMVHLYLSRLEFSEEIWKQLVLEKVKTFDQKYAALTPADVPGYPRINDECPFIEDQATHYSRLKGFVRRYGSIDHAEDMATVGEHLYRPTLSEEEINLEDPPFLKAKIEVVRGILNQKMGFTAEVAERYWSTVAITNTDVIDSVMPGFSDPKVEERTWKDFWRRASIPR